MAWECDRCETLHTQNPRECRSCGHNIFQPVSDAELQRPSTSNTSPDRSTVTSAQVTGTAQDPDYDTSPDVAIDGSVADDSTEIAPPEQSGTSAGSGRVRSVYHTLRGLVRAPFGLLRRYFIPILAFLLVFGAVAYLLIYDYWTLLRFSNSDRFQQPYKIQGASLPPGFY